jgi:hypothetical protein
MEYVRQIKIAASLEKSHHFIKNVENLPIWTRFFKNCISCDGTIAHMQTALGIAQTSILEKHTKSSIELLIHSKFNNHQETALIILSGDMNHTEVNFYLKTPSEINEEQQARMLANLEQELLILKHCLESCNA